MPYTVPVVAAPGGPEPAFRADLRTIKTMKDQGWSLFPAATPPVVDRGITLNGVDQYALFTNQVSFQQAFVTGVAGELTIYQEFWPNFAYDAAGPDMMLYATNALWYFTYFPRVAPFNMTFSVSGGIVLTISGASYGPLWRTNGQNKVAVCLKTGDNRCYFNGVDVGNSANGITKLPPTALSIGSGVAGGSTRYFGGTIKEFHVYGRKFNPAEAIELTAVS